MKALFFSFVIIFCWSCNRQVANTTGWDIDRQYFAKMEKQRLIDQKKSAKKHPKLTFIKKDFLIGTELVTNDEFRAFLNSYEALFGKDTLFQLGFDSLQIEKIKLQSLSGSITTNISLQQALIFLNWKTNFMNYKILVKEGIIKETFSNSVDQENYPPSNFEEYLNGQLYPIKDDHIDLSPCGEFKKVRIEDGIIMNKYTLMDTTDYKRVNSVLKTPILPSDCELFSNDSLKINNCGFRYKIVPHQRPTSWE